MNASLFFIIYSKIMRCIMLNKIYFWVFLLLWANAAIAQDANPPIITENYNQSVVDSTSDSTTTVISPPPSAISPSINSSNSDLCTVGVAGAVQTQILGISAGTTFTEDNCIRLKNAKTLYDMGMKVAAVSVMCEDPNVFQAMMNAGTPCPFDGLIGQQARDAWNSPENETLRPDSDSNRKGLGISNDDKSTLIGGGIVGGLLLLLLL